MGLLITDRYNVAEYKDRKCRSVCAMASMIGIRCYHEYAKAMLEFSVFSPLLSSPYYPLDHHRSSMITFVHCRCPKFISSIPVNPNRISMEQIHSRLLCVHDPAFHLSFNPSCRCSRLPSLTRSTNPDPPMAYPISLPRCVFSPLANL